MDLASRTPVVDAMGKDQGDGHAWRGLVCNREKVGKSRDPQLTSERIRSEKAE